MGDERPLWSSDLYIQISPNTYHGSFYYINSRFWDPKLADNTKFNPKVTLSMPMRVRNPIQVIQSYLFANQFVVYLTDSDLDRQIRIHGGVVAKDFLGKYSNKTGSDQEAPPVNKPGDLSWKPTTTGFINPYATSGLIIVEDPRFQFDTTLLYHDFGSVDLKY